MNAASRDNAVKRSGRAGTLVGMGSCYALGTFTDNFYKQAAILLASTAAAPGMAGRTDMQSIATVLFSLPFVLFSAWAGALADRVPKRNIVIGVKTLELLALLLGGVMLVLDNWLGILAVMFFMGTQSTFFSPAINGSIPENFEAAKVPRANSLIKLASTAAILAGMAAAGFVLDMKETGAGGILSGLARGLGLTGGDYGRFMAAFVVAAVALLGLGTAFTLRGKPAAMPRGGRPPFPWGGPVESVRQALACRGDKHLTLVLLADAWFFGIAAIAVISIANLGTSLGYSKSIAGMLTALLMIGVAAGSLIAGRFPATSWRFLLAPSAGGMAVMLLLAGATPLFPASGGLNIQLAWLGLTLFLAGVCGGLYLIPLESFIQVRPEPDRKGKIIAVSNFLSFVAMAVFGAAFMLVRLLPPALTFLVYGVATLCFLRFVAIPRLRRIGAESLRESASSFPGFILRVILSLRYTVAEQGLESLPPEKTGGEGSKPGMLILPNHPALIDPVIVYSRLAGLHPRPLSDEGQMRGPVQKNVARFLRAVTIPDLARAGRKGAESVRKGLDNITAALKAGDNVLLYPSGRVYRSEREVVGNNAAVAHILEAVPEARVLLVRTKGLWGSSFGYASGRIPRILPLLLRGALAILANGIFFSPRRKIEITYAEPADLPRDGDKVRLNRYLEEFYNVAQTPPIFVPRFFWQGREEQEAAIEAAAGAPHEPGHASAPGADIPDDVREGVFSILRNHAGLDRNTGIFPEQNLVTDLFMDSLSLMETVLEIENTFGYPVTSPESLQTVGDCLLAAVGKLEETPGDPREPAPRAWHLAGNQPDADAPLTLAPGAANIVDAFFRLAKSAPSLPLTAERSGLRTRKELLIGVLALSRRFAGLPGTRLGIMLPAVPAAVAVWLAAMHAGKEPVFINWTVGRRNLEHCLALAGATQVVTASALLDQLQRTGNNVRGLPVTWIAAERLGASLSLPEKLRAAALTALHCSVFPFSLDARRVRDIAAVLFTSGSESKPKGVPLTHANIMQNAADVLEVLQIRKKDRLLAMLPPFHSFGLLAGLALPASTGFATAYHPNPTESAALVALVRDYKLTLLGATPTFLDGMLAKAKGGNDLGSLRYAFAGAEKCPDHVYRAFAACCPDAALCEGYGITECSPVVAVNRPGNVVPGSIGHALPSVETALVLEENGKIISRAAANQTAMLLVRGPSIFSGYLASADPGPEEPPPDPFVAFEDKKWYRTGDLVAADETGRLFFKGRLKRFVKLGGEMISLPQMEDVLQQALATRPDLPGDGKPYIAVEARRGSEEAGQAELVAYTTLPLDAGYINSLLRSAGLGPLYAVRRAVRLEAIPLLGSGKTDYRALEDAPARMDSAIA